jgi:hypothetical protein
LLQALIVSIAGRVAVIVGRETGRAGEREANRMYVGSERLVENGSFRAKEDDGGQRSDGGKLPRRAVIGDE